MRTIEYRQLLHKKSTRYIEKVNFLTQCHMLSLVLVGECRQENSCGAVIQFGRRLAVIQPTFPR